VPSALSEVTLTDPNGAEHQLQARAGIAIVPHPDQPGFYLVSYQGPHPGSALAVVNLTSAAESDLRPTPPGSAAANGEVRATSSPVTEAAGDLSFVLALIALLAIALEVVWLTRAKGRALAGSLRPRRPERGGAA
jgi:hypothetical protein